MATYVNFLRLTELATGEGSGTWGNTTNTNLELIGEALGYATQQVFGSDADATTTVADGVSDPARAMYYKITSAVSLTTTRTLTIAPNTLSRVMFIENATSGSQSIAISQGSGANVTIATGKTAVVYLDGAGAGAAVVDAMAGVDPGVTDTLAEVLTAGNTTTTDQKIQFRDSAIYINSSADGQLDIVADTEIQIAATTIDVNGTLAFDSLKGTGATTVTNILDEDNMASDSATAIATQQSIKAYVDSQVGTVDTLSEILANGNTTGSNDIAVDTTQKVQFRDAAIYINSSVDGQLDIVADTEIQIAATTVDLNGNLDVSGTTVSAGKITADAGIDIDNINIDGTTIALSSGDLTIDVAGDIIFDADGDDFIFAAAGTNIGKITNSTSDFLIRSLVQDQDIIFKGDDAGSVITALTLDMSNAGYATFNSGLNSGGVIELPQKASFPATGFVHYTNSYVYAFGGAQGSIFKDRTGVTEFLKLQPSQIVFNEDGGDMDFRVESDGATHMLFVDAGNNRVGIGESSPDTPLHLTTSGTGFAVTIESTSGSATSGPDISIFKNSPSPADEDDLGRIYFHGENDGGTKIEYGMIRASVNDVTAGTEDSSLQFYTYVGGAQADRLGLEATETVFNESSQNVDFRVESDSNANMLFVDAGTNRIGINEASPGYILDIRGGNGDQLRLNNGGEQFTQMYFQNNSSNIGAIWADNTGNKFEFYAYAGKGAAIYSNATERVNFKSTGEVVFNDSGADYDFRVETDGSSNTFFVDGSTNNIGIQSGTEWAIVGGGSGTSSSGVQIDMSYDGGIYAGSAYWAGGLGTGTNFWRDASGWHYKLSGRQATVHFQNSQAGSHSFLSQTSGNAGDIIAWASLLQLDRTTTIFNETGADVDFRIESDGNANMLFVDGGNNEVLIGKNSGSTSVAGIGATVGSSIGQFQIAKTNSGTHNAVRFYHSGANVGNIQYSDSATIYLTSSDRRLKENISNADDAGDLIDAIQVRQFDWIVDGEHQRYGMVAQELNAVAPEAVSAPENPDEMMGVDYSKLVPMLIKEIQSLRARVAALES